MRPEAPLYGWALLTSVVMPAFPAVSTVSRYSDQLPYGLVQMNGPGERDGTRMDALR
ncbi:hypothetical protein GCM10018980_46150 [Streptomyces capoamus]|uniref:Uncharacterized protein n=1 Tax=Streptomyces capoamus TaxID=68183 RepID=A0A919EYJ5_9ACTN|nr:hypothetical protein GCM10010501_62190 [Streptomyces libani subsp. rufus]GHG58696.1 hypothetical protein GCM10018980_46150 [Streptomyces capoamus]